MSLLGKKSAAEFLGTFWLTFGGCGGAVLAAKFLAVEGSTPLNLGIGFVGVSLAFELTVVAMIRNERDGRRKHESPQEATRLTH